MKAVVAAFNQEKALVGAFSVITNLWMELFEPLVAILYLYCHYNLSMLIQMNTAPANKPLELEAAMSQARDFLAQYYGDTNHWDICNEDHIIPR